MPSMKTRFEISNISADFDKIGNFEGLKYSEK